MGRRAVMFVVGGRLFIGLNCLSGPVKRQPNHVMYSLALWSSEFTASCQGGETYMYICWHLAISGYDSPTANPVHMIDEAIGLSAVHALNLDDIRSERYVEMNAHDWEL
ncbi:hypothetical protein BDD12DRAFT_978475 [Trichophaea hybrida]|nr:hypothetical protein BDD12DRAFT_978475 [Trichophaea hybrida]